MKDLTVMPNRGKISPASPRTGVVTQPGQCVSREIVMGTEIKLVEKAVDEYDSYLKSISDGIVKGTLEGIKKSVPSGIKNGIKDGIKECFSKGLSNVTGEDIKAIIMDIPQKIEKTCIKESAKQIMNICTRYYVENVRRKIVKQIKKKELRLSKKKVEDVLPLLKKAEQEAMKKVNNALPNKYFLKDIMASIQKSLEESLDNNFKACEEELLQKTEN
jgi:hypothetical protein